MHVIGLTGSIGMGKSETAKMFERSGVPVFDADAAVHVLYARDGAAVAPIAALVPEAVVDGMVDRTRLARAVLGNGALMRKLEMVVHPLVQVARRQFLERHAIGGTPVVVLDIPLLFEVGADREVDSVVVVSAPEPVQRRRVLDRPGMTDEKLSHILAKQLPDRDKRARADFVIETDKGFEHAEAQVHHIIAAVQKRPRRRVHEPLTA